MVETGTAPPTINSTLSGLKFFFDVTLGHAELLVKVQPVHQPRPLPVVLSCEEVARLIAAAPNPKYQAALSVAYGAGLRASEVCALKVTDIDSERMTLRVEQGKGGKDRYAMLSPVLLERLRAWWRVRHAQGKILPNGWLSNPRASCLKGHPRARAWLIERLRCIAPARASWNSAPPRSTASAVCSRSWALCCH